MRVVQLTGSGANPDDAANGELHTRCSRIRRLTGGGEMSELEALGRQLIAARRDEQRLRASVKAWMDAEGKLGNLRTNGDCPTWQEYTAAAAVWHEAVRQLDERIANESSVTRECGHPGSTVRNCPYSADVNNDNTQRCVCCDSCAHECAMDI